MSEQPWYKDGLQFTCTQCGNCCTGPAGFVWVNDEEIAAIAKFVGKSVEGTLADHARRIGRKVSLQEFSNGDCTFFDGQARRCTIYPVRPRQCRTWPFWDSNLESPQAWRRVEESCPGAGSGNFFSLQEIEAQAAVIRL
ncbi:MAG: YkgJ family cysteine cluster protein [Planctomycetaceae bacterium]